MLRHWIPFDNLDLSNLLMGVLDLLEYEFNSRKTSKKRAFCKKLSSTIRLFTDDDWSHLSCYSNAISILEQNLGKVNCSIYLIILML